MSETCKNVCEFAAFRLDPQERLLLRNGTPVPLTPKVFDTLVLLVRNSGHLLLKDELMKSLWPDSFVEEANLSQNVSIRRRTLGEKLHEQRYIATVPGKGYRFVAAVKEVANGANDPQPDDLLVRSYSHSRVAVEEESEQEDDRPIVSTAIALPARKTSLLQRWHLRLALIAVVAAATLFLVLNRLQRHRKGVGVFRSIVIADFSNHTGDPVFDDTLKQAVKVDLEQSPILNILSDEKVAHGLRMMERPPHQPLTPELARELCQRLEGDVLLNGAIGAVGRQYVITLSASNCATGSSLRDEQARATDKEHVLEALDDAAARLRASLGESSASMQEGVRQAGRGGYNTFTGGDACIQCRPAGAER